MLVWVTFSLLRFLINRKSCVVWGAQIAYCSCFHITISLIQMTIYGCIHLIYIFVGHDDYEVERARSTHTQTQQKDTLEICLIDFTFIVVQNRNWHGTVNEFGWWLLFMGIKVALMVFLLRPISISWTWNLLCHLQMYIEVHSC